MEHKSVGALVVFLTMSGCCFTKDVHRGVLVKREAAVTPQPPPDPSMAGAASELLPVVYRLPLSGWGTFSVSGARLTTGSDIADRALRARALVLQDPQGNKVALVSTDLHGGSRYITEYVAKQLNCRNFHAGNIFMSATHNHAGPGGLYASPYFDGMMASTEMKRAPNDEGRIAFNKELADSIGDAIVAAIVRADDTKKAAKIGFGHGRFNMTFNRSLSAFMENFSSTKEAIDTVNSAFKQNAQNQDELARAAVDPNVYTIAAFSFADDAFIGSFTTVNAHSALLHRDTTRQSADFFGQAAALVERDGGVVGLSAGAQGDVDPIDDRTLEAFDKAREADAVTMKNDPNNNHLMVVTFGEALSKAVATSIEKAKENAAPIARLGAAFTENQISGAFLPDLPPPPCTHDCNYMGPSFQRMPFVPEMGHAAVAGSELGRGPPIYAEGARRFSDSLQSPKDTSATMLYSPPLTASNSMLRDQDPKFSMRLVEVQTTSQQIRVLGLPGEPTTWLGYQLRRLLDPSLTASMVAGVTGDYQGYLTTTAEYGSQQYEGGSTMWGPNTEQYLRMETLGLIKQLTENGLYVPAKGDVYFSYSEETWKSRIRDGFGCFGPAQSRYCLDVYADAMTATKSAAERNDVQRRICELCAEAATQCQDTQGKDWGATCGPAPTH